MKLVKKLPLYLLLGTLLCTGCSSNAKQNQMPTNQKANEVQEVTQVDSEEEEPREAEETIENHSPENIMINQLGYLPNDAKQVVFRGDTLDESFEVVKADTNEVVFEGSIGEGKKNLAADEEIFVGDFSELKDEGTYKIVTHSMGESYSFKVASDVYKDVFKDAVRFFYLQRCGEEISETCGEKWAHPACHTQKAVLYGTDTQIDVSGGWHDAGDYGRYVVATAVSAADLLLAYKAYPEVFGDDTNIPESGNGIPDVLDEVRGQLEWLFKMQNKENGGVYHKVTCKNFPGFVMPQDEKDELIVCPETTTATGDFIAIMSLGYDAFKEIEPSFADECLKGAKEAWQYLESTPSQVVKNPEGIVTGEYGDRKDDDERLWAALELYKVTGEEYYKEKAIEIVKSASKNGWVYGWQNVGAYALEDLIAILKDTDEVEEFKTLLQKDAKKILDKAQKDGYGIGDDSGLFYWGSNMTVLSNSIKLCAAYEMNQDEAYLQYAKEMVNYCFGKNPMNRSYVTGYGSVSPLHPHHRVTFASKNVIPGMLIGGPNAGREDDVAKVKLASMPPAKCYIDDAESYATNEVDIYWNSKLVYALARTHMAPEA